MLKKKQRQDINVVLNRKKNSFEKVSKILFGFILSVFECYVYIEDNKKEMKVQKNCF